MKDNWLSEFQAFAHIAIVTTIVIFSIILITLNLLLGWEAWPIPILVVFAVSSVIMHIRRSPNARTRIFVYATILLVDMFYYNVNVVTMFDSSLVIVLFILLFSMTGERVIAITFLIVGYFGMIFHLVSVRNTTGLDLSNASVIRAILHFLLVPIAAFLVLHLMKSIRDMRYGYEDNIERLKEQNKSANNFLANVSHEIRTPINAVVGLTGVCVEKENDPDIRRDLHAVVQAGHRVAEQIGNILDYSEIDMSSVHVNEEDYSISTVLHDLVNRIEPYKTDNVELVIDVDPTLPAILHSDVSKIKKILWHLVFNGLKYTTEGGVYVHLYSDVQAYGINLNIDVSDTGVGMDKEELSRVFESFYQASSGRNRTAGGLGLGMPVVSGFASILGGFVSLDSEEGKGTTVHVCIPQKVTDRNQCMSIENHENLSLGSYLHFERFSNPQVREYYNDMLRNVVRGLRVPLHKVDNLDGLKQLVEHGHLTHLFVGEDEYRENSNYLNELSESMQVVVVADSHFVLPRESKIAILKKPFYCFPVIDVINKGKSSETSKDSVLTCPGAHALVVDDEPLNLTVARGVLKRYDMIVTTAASGPEAIELYENHAYDIVFMDHMMPGMDGIEAVRRIRMLEIDSHKVTPVVALTANATSAARERFSAEGFDGFLSKPIEIVELDRVLKNVIPGHCVFTEKKQEIAEVSDKEPDTAKNDQVDHDKLLTDVGIDIKAGRSYSQNDEGLYRTLLDQFYDDAVLKQRKLGEYLVKEDYHNYEILIHALKSTSKLIGAEELSARALSLERAAKQGDGAFIRDNHDRMIALLSDTAAVIGVVLNKSDDTAEAEDENEEIFFFSAEGGEQS